MPVVIPVLFYKGQLFTPVVIDKTPTSHLAIMYTIYTFNSILFAVSEMNKADIEFRCGISHCDAV